MLTYRGDKFIKGKKFTINESTYRFQKRDKNENLVFKSNEGKTLKLTEAEFNSKSLKEGTNGYSEQSMIDTIKSYYEDGNEMAKDMANMFISTYATESEKYPKLYAYVKKLINKNHSAEDTSKEANPFDVNSAINGVANEYGVDFDSDVPFENFYAPDSDGEDEDDVWYSNDYDWAAFYDKILHDLGYGENPVLKDLRAEVHEVSDGSYEMHLMLGNKLYTIDLDAWDKPDNVKDNVEAIIDLLGKDSIKEGLGFEEESEKILDFDEAVKGYIEFELGMDDMDPETAKYLKSLDEEDIKKIARKVQNEVDDGLNEIINQHLYDYKTEKLDLPRD